MKKSLFILLLYMPVQLFSQPSLQFIGEKIDFTLTAERFFINGIYYFANSTSNEIKQTILFPFPDEADSVVVKWIYNLNYSESIDYQLLDRAIYFKILIQPEDTIGINIAYSQNTDKENVYILKSAQSWAKPFRADFSLVIDESIQVDSLSLKPDSLVNNTYYWTKLDFFPDEDFKVWIKSALDFLKSWEPPYDPVAALTLFTQKEDFHPVIGGGYTCDNYQEWTEAVPRSMYHEQEFYDSYQHEVKYIETVVLSPQSGVVTLSTFGIVFRKRGFTNEHQELLLSHAGRKMKHGKLCIIMGHMMNRLSLTDEIEFLETVTDYPKDARNQDY